MYLMNSEVLQNHKMAEGIEPPNAFVHALMHTYMYVQYMQYIHVLSCIQQSLSS